MLAVRRRVWLSARLVLAAALGVWGRKGNMGAQSLGRALAALSVSSARRGAYRVIYRIDDDALAVHVVRIDHRADVYRA